MWLSNLPLRFSDSSAGVLDRIGDGADPLFGCEASGVFAAPALASLTPLATAPFATALFGILDTSMSSQSVLAANTVVALAFLAKIAEDELKASKSASDTDSAFMRWIVINLSKSATTFLESSCSSVPSADREEMTEGWHCR